MALIINELIKRLPPGTKGKVQRASMQHRAVLQETLRAECRLVMRTDDAGGRAGRGAQVRLEVAPGYPEALATLEFPSDFDLRALLAMYRGALEKAASSATKLQRLHRRLSGSPETREWAAIDTSQIAAVGQWAQGLVKVLDEADPVELLLRLREDILGAYLYECDGEVDDRVANRATIRLYWGVIGIIAEMLHCKLEDLTVVVLAHELAHAYTQLGADIEGRRWLSSAYADADVALKEGIAQFYTQRVLRRLEGRFEGAYRAYQKLLPRQPDEYRVHLEWVEHCSPEAVRRAMLEVRRQREGALEDFQKRLERAHFELGDVGVPVHDESV